MIMAKILQIGEPSFAGRIFPEDQVRAIVAGVADGRTEVVYDQNIRGVSFSSDRVCGYIRRVFVEDNWLICEIEPVESEVGVEYAALCGCGFPIGYAPVGQGELDKGNVVSGFTYVFMNAYFKGEA